MGVEFFGHVEFLYLSYAVYTIWTGVERNDGRNFKNISDGSLVDLTNMDR